MPPNPYQDLGRRLRRAGLSRYWAERMAGEIQDHYDDIVAAARARGYDRQQADRLAAQELGCSANLVGEAAAFTRLLRPTARLQAVSRVLGLGGTAGLQIALDRPSTPLELACRVGVASVAGALVTGGLLFALQVSIQLS